ncbi:MAG: hypothetical protein H6752_20300 [Candidatus Omnitrophica bacterium]|nr:hypothetical protein [Candidatus Omnitrophota bacterium]
MRFNRSSKQIAKSVATDQYQSPTYFKRKPYWFKKSRKLWILLSILGVLWVIISLTGLGGALSGVGMVGENIFMNGPLATYHQSLAKDCGACHTQRFSHVRDADCMECHAATIQVDSSSSAVHHFHEEKAVPRCAECHIEHQGTIELADMNDSFCTACHRTLEPDSGAKAVAFTTVPGDHPNLRMWRLNLPDPGRLKFNHKMHMNPEGVLTGEGNDPQAKRVLKCEDCHRLDPRGEYMEPVVYEEHCGVCHAHRIQPLPDGDQVPHDGPEGVREFLLRYYYTHPEKAEPEQNRRLRYVDRDEEAFEKSVRARVNEIERIIYRIGSEERCVQCHYVTKEASTEIEDLAPLPKVETPDVPERWLDHSRFAHEAHSTVSCEECHPGVLQSEKATDLLFFDSIVTCAKCHAPKQDRNNCTLCHDFHPNNWKASKTVEAQNLASLASP